MGVNAGSPGANDWIQYKPLAALRVSPAFLILDMLVTVPARPKPGTLAGRRLRPSLFPC
jgi:hypothetical protein